MKFTLQNFKENSSKWLLISATVMGIGLTSCEKEDYSEIATQTNSITSLDARNSKGEKIYDTQAENQRIFGKALLEAMKKSPALRKFIKTEALKKFNHDYDVLFATVKSEVIEEGKTFRDIILEEVESEEILKQIEFTNPLLTIFVPSLPENSFSAENWDTENQIPDVALRLHTTNDVPCFSLDKGEYVIEAKYIPSYPIMVIKDNERVTSSLTKGYELVKTKNIFADIEGIEYKFINKVFENKKILNRNTLISGQSVPPKLVQAFNIYKNTNGWHRDYIYYDITPTQDKGEFNNDFREHITYFKFIENTYSGATLAYNRISSTYDGDPQYNPVSSNSSQTTAWTDGGYEFKVTSLINARNGIGSEFGNYFFADPQELFYIEYERVPMGLFVATNIKSRYYYPSNLPIISWDIDQYATTITITIEEEDASQIISESVSNSSEFATNFGLDSDSIFKKIGLKFGASLKVSRTDNFNRTFSEENDKLGSVIVNFADDIIVNNVGYNGINIYNTKEYSSGLYIISVEPK